MNVCTDQLLLTLADPGQIIGLSRYSRDAARNPGRPMMRADIRILSGGAEDILVLKPDVVVASLFDKRVDAGATEGERTSSRRIRRAAQARRGQGPNPRDGRHRRHPDRAAAEIARLDAAMARARQAVAHKRYRVLPLSRRGWVSGSESLLSSLLTETGLFNAAGDSVSPSAVSPRWRRS